MKYMGSKARHAKAMLPIILAGRKENQWYVEPFVGGANMIDKVPGNRIGADVNEYLMDMWKAIQAGWIPPDHISAEEYTDIRNNKSSVSGHMLGWVGHCCSYNGKWFGGYAGRIITKDGNPRDYQDEAKRAVLKQVMQLTDVRLVHCGYINLEIPPNSIIYCDPPYKDTTKYKDSFEHEPFYDWCRKQHALGHQVFVSEYQMPEDFICVWSKEVNNSLTKDTGGKKGVEKLFTLR